MISKRVTLHNIKTIDDVYKFRLNELRENNTTPKIILLSEEQRRKLILEAMLLSLEQALSLSNINDTLFVRDNIFKLFNITISTQERERK